MPLVRHGALADNRRSLDGRNDPLRASHLHGYMGVPSSAALFNKRGGLLTHINAARKAPVNVAK